MSELKSSGSLRRPGGWLAAVLPLVCIVLPWVIHYKYISDDAILPDTDHAQLQYSRFVILSRAFHGGEGFPWWQSLLQGGGPFHANPENPTLYPPAIVLGWLCPPMLAMNLFILIHLSFAAAGMYFLVKRLAAHCGSGAHVPAVGAVAAAVFISMNPYMRLESFVFVNYGAAQSWIPWIFLCSESVLSGARPARAAAGLAIAMAMQVFAGGLYVYAFTAVMLLLFFIVSGFAGGAGRRRRALTYGAMAGGSTLLFAIGRLLPSLYWIGTTERHGALDFETARGATLMTATHDFGRALAHLDILTGGTWMLAPALMTLWAIRVPSIRAWWVLLLIFLGVALGPLYVVLYQIPPFNQIRVGAKRAYSVVNPAMTILAGVGFSQLIGWLYERAKLRFRAGFVLLGLALVAGALPFWLTSTRFDNAIHNPVSREAHVARYPTWKRVAERMASRPSGWRAMNIEFNSPNLWNEQFITSHLGIETLNGLLGEAYPRVLSAYLWGPLEKPHDTDRRLRRMGALAVRDVVTERSDLGTAGALEQTAVAIDELLVPRLVDGKYILDNPYARPRAFVPAAVFGVFGPGARRACTSLFDRTSDVAGLVSWVDFGDHNPPTPRELAALRICYVVDNGDANSIARFEAARATAPAARIEKIHLDPTAGDPPIPGSAREIMADLLQTGAAAQSLTFHGQAGGNFRVDATPAPVDRFVVMAGTISIFGECHARSAGSDVAIRIADGLPAAAVLPAGAADITVNYSPRYAYRGLWLASAGVIAVFILLYRDRLDRSIAAGSGQGIL